MMASNALRRRPERKRGALTRHTWRHTNRISRCADLKTRRELKLGANGSGQSPELDKARLRGLRAVGEGRLG